MQTTPPPIPIRLRIDQARFVERRAAWEKTLRLRIQSVTSGGQVIFIFGDPRAGGLFALSLATGKTLWSHSGAFSGGVVSGSTLYALKPDENQNSASLVAFHAQTGAVLRTTSMNGCGTLIGLHLVRDSIIAVCADRVVAVDAMSGKLLWNNDTVTNAFGQNVFVNDDDVVVMSENPAAEGNPQLVVGLDLTRGTQLWQANNATLAYATRAGVFLNDLTESDGAQAHMIEAAWRSGSTLRSFVTPLPPPSGSGSYSGLVAFPYAYYYINGLPPSLQKGPADMRLIGANLLEPTAASVLLNPPGFPIGQTPDGRFILDVSHRAALLDTRSARLTIGIPGALRADSEVVWTGEPPLRSVLGQTGGTAYTVLSGDNTITRVITDCNTRVESALTARSTELLFCTRSSRDRAPTTALYFISTTH